MQTDLAKELLDLEMQFWKSMKDKNVDAALRLTYEPCIVAGAHGVSSIDKKTFAKMMATGTWTLQDFEIRDVKVQQLNEEVAIIGYKVHEELTVDGKPLNQPFLDPNTMMADPKVYPCLGNEFGPVTVPEGRLWVMGDNRTHSADSRAHCGNTPADAQRGLLCTGDPMAGTIPIDNVIGKARFIAWPPSRWGGVHAVNPQTQ